MVARKKNGHFEKGASGNPGGRRKSVAEFAKLILDETKDARELMQIVLKIARGKLTVRKAMGVAGVGIEQYDAEPDHEVRMEAIKWLADRALGKALAKIELTGEDGKPIEVEDARERLAARIAALAAASDKSGRGS